MFRSLHYNEFVIDFGQDPEKIILELEKFNVQAGLPLGRFYPNLKNCMLFCVTEQNSLEDIELLIKTIKRVT